MFHIVKANPKNNDHIREKITYDKDLCGNFPTLTRNVRISTSAIGPRKEFLKLFIHSFFFGSTTHIINLQFKKLKVVFCMLLLLFKLLAFSHNMPWSDKDF